MKKILMIAGPLILLLWGTQVNSETIILKSEKWCPFACEPTSSTKSKDFGYIVEITKIIFERKGHNIDYQIDSWTNSIESARNGSTTAVVALSRNEAPDFIFPTINMGSNKECFYVNPADKWEYLTLENLKDRKIGISDNYVYSAELTSYFRDHSERVSKGIGSDALMTSLDNLKAKKIDTVVENPFVFNYSTENKKIRDNFVEAGCTEGDPLYVAFSPKNQRSKEFAKILADGIEDLRKDGTLGKIITKYSLKDWSP